jgi:hypothetical protein
MNFADERTVDLGRLHYSDAPKTWHVDIPEDATRVEIAMYDKDINQVNRYGGWNGYLKLNGSFLWKMEGLNSEKIALISDYVQGQSVLETTGRKKWLDISSLVKKGKNSITYFHYTGGDGIGVVLRITKGKTSSDNVDSMKPEYEISIVSCDLRYFETIFLGRLTKNGIPVSNVQIGIEDPLRRFSTLSQRTDESGYFTYSTNPYSDYRKGEVFLFVYGDEQRPYIIAEKFSKYKVVDQDILRNKEYTKLNDIRKNNIQTYQKIVNGTVSVDKLSMVGLETAQKDVMNIMIDSALSEKVSAGMEIVDWAGSVGMCGKGIVAAGPSGGLSTAACAPLGIKLVNEGVDFSTDILLEKGIISGRSAQIIDNTSSTATSCISISQPIDTASCLGAVASGTLRIVSYELENNDYGQPAVVVKLAKRTSDVVDYALVIVESLK